MAAQTTQITSVEQIVGSVVARVTTLETGAALTATGSLGSHGPGSSDDNRNSRRSLGTFPCPEDEHARSAVHWGYEKDQQSLGRVQNTNLLQTCQSTLQNRFPVSQTRIRNKSQLSELLWPKTRMMVSPMRLIVRFATADSPRNRENFLRWRVSSTKLLELFPEGDDAGALIVAALDARSQVLSIKDRRNGIGKPVFKLSPFGSAQLFTLVAPDLCVPGIPEGVLQQVISQASTANV